MMNKRITLRISQDGQVKAEVTGFHGKKCADYISILEQMLDAETIDSEANEEYYLNEDLFISKTQLEELDPIPQAKTLGRT